MRIPKTVLDGAVADYRAGVPVNEIKAKHRVGGYTLYRAIGDVSVRRQRRYAKHALEKVRMVLMIYQGHTGKINHRTRKIFEYVLSAGFNPDTGDINQNPVPRRPSPYR